MKKKDCNEEERENPRHVIRKERNEDEKENESKREWGAGSRVWVRVQLVVYVWARGMWRI